MKPDPADLVENTAGATAARSRAGGAAADSRDDAGGNSGLKSWRPGNQPPQAPTWIHGPAFGDDDRPEGIEQDDWSHLMVFRYAPELLYSASHVCLIQAMILRCYNDKVADRKILTPACRTMF